MNPDEGFWKWLIGGVVGAVTGGFGYHKYIERKIDQKADKDYVVKELQEAKEERASLKGHVAKLFDQIRENEQRAQDRYERLMDRLPR